MCRLEGGVESVERKVWHVVCVCDIVYPSRSTCYAFIKRMHSGLWILSRYCLFAQRYFTSSDPHHGISRCIYIYWHIFWHLPNILSGIYFDILSAILSGIYSGILSEIYSGILSDIYSDILSGILSDILFWHALCSGPTGATAIYSACSWGPAGTTLILSLLFGSGRDSLRSLVLAVEVRQGLLWSWACCLGPAETHCDL